MIRDSTTKHFAATANGPCTTTKHKFANLGPQLDHSWTYSCGSMTKILNDGNEHLELWINYIDNLATMDEMLCDGVRLWINYIDILITMDRIWMTMDV